VRGQIALLAIWSGATFFINAFMGVWLLAPIGAVIALLLIRRRIALGSLLSQVAIGAIACAALAAPVISNVISNPDFGKAPTFNYREYLHEYYGGHFFVDANPFYELALLLALVGLGWLALSRLGGRAAEFKAALLGLVSLYVIGILVSVLATSPLILTCSCCGRA
jgi:hypothetical protein